MSVRPPPLTRMPSAPLWSAVSSSTAPTASFDDVSLTSSPELRARLAPPPTPETTEHGDASEYVHILLDQSSSMSHMNDAVFAGACEYVAALPNHATARVSTFATGVRVGEEQDRQSALQSLQRERTANGRTSLYDAIGQAMLLELRTPPRSGITTVLVVTDGMDTCSTTHTPSTVAGVVRLAEARGVRVIFLGANMDAIATAGCLGIGSLARAMTFDVQREASVRNAMRAASEEARRHRQGGLEGFTDVERQNSMNSLQSPPAADDDRPTTPTWPAPAHSLRTSAFVDACRSSDA